MNLKLPFFAFFVLSVFSLQAAVVDTLSVYSPAMKKNVQVVKKGNLRNLSCIYCMDMAEMPIPGCLSNRTYPA